jgi:hypothetical protein
MLYNGGFGCWRLGYLDWSYGIDTTVSNSISVGIGNENVLRAKFLYKLYVHCSPFGLSTVS